MSSPSQHGHGDTAPTLLSTLQSCTSPQGSSASQPTHPFAVQSESTVTFLHDILAKAAQMSHCLTANVSVLLTNPKLLSLYRQQAAISHTVYLSDQNVDLTLKSLRNRAGISYGEDIPLDLTTIVDWCISRLEAWGTSAGMEAFKEQEREGRMTVVLGGKVLVIDIDFAVNRYTPNKPTVSVANLKTSYAIPNGAAGSTTQGSLSLDGFLANRLQMFLTSVQNETDEQDSIEAARLGKLFAEYLVYLMQLDQLALSEGDSGLRWFSDIDSLAIETERFAKTEAEAITTIHLDAQAPLDIFLIRSHALPLPYLITPSISFLVYMSPLAYLSTLRTCPSDALREAKPDLPKLDIPFDHLRSKLASHPRPEGVTLATLSLSSTHRAISYPDTMDMSVFGSRPTFSLAPDGEHIDHALPQVIPSLKAGLNSPPGWVLDFTDGGKHPGVVMSQSRMRAVELVLNPISGMAHLNNVPMMAFGTGSWLDLLLNPGNPISPERYTALHISPTSMHPPLHLRLTAPEEPGFILEKVPVRNLKEIWGIFEIVREQCWLNEIIRGCQWIPEGLQLDGKDDDTDDSDASEDDLQAILKGTLAPRRIPVNVYIPSDLADPLFDAEDMTGMSLQHSLRSHRPRVLMSSPERPPIPGLVEISVSLDPSRSRGIALDINGAMGADLNIDVLEEVCRRGGLLSLPGRVWAKSHGSA